MIIREYHFNLLSDLTNVDPTGAVQESAEEAKMKFHQNILNAAMKINSNPQARKEMEERAKMVQEFEVSDII